MWGARWLVLPVALTALAVDAVAVGLGRESRSLNLPRRRR